MGEWGELCEWEELYEWGELGERANEVNWVNDVIGVI